ncbi:MAG: type II toxin-antitoxin system VapB family antitoxin [Rhodocyclaceae bacterium]|nr:type II toxin-antitoxin system VapB family antitoxin [Rhodocyclaceae bacterium]
MRTTIDLSDEIFRRAKAEAALRGLKFKDLVEEGLRRVLEHPEPMPVTSFHELMRDCCGVAGPTPPDYASNPAHLEGFGRSEPR